jgi:hypothetical protein
VDCLPGHINLALFPTAAVIRQRSAIESEEVPTAPATVYQLQSNTPLPSKKQLKQLGPLSFVEHFIYSIRIDF